MNAAIQSHWWKVVPLESEVRWLEQLGTDRENASNAAGLKPVAKNQSAALHQSGIQGEWAVSLIVNMTFRHSPIAERSEMQKGDLGGIVEVKACRGSRPYQWNLLVNEYRLRSEYVYINTITAFWPECVYVTGWCFGRDLMVSGERRMGVTGYPVLALGNDRLNDIKTIFEVL